jgi:hypothetical protein
MLATLMIGHHFSISAFCNALRASGVCPYGGGKAETAVRPPLDHQGAGPISSGTRLIIARNRPVLRRGSIRKVEKNFIYITPAPMFRRIVALNDRVRGGVKMFGRMSVRRVIATADVTAGPANTQVNPGRTDL